MLICTTKILFENIEYTVWHFLLSKKVNFLLQKSWIYETDNCSNNIFCKLEIIKMTLSTLLQRIFYNLYKHPIRFKFYMYNPETYASHE